MKLILQRVTSASVQVRDSESSSEAIFRTVGAISRGYMVLLGIKKGDTQQESHFLIKKLLELRLFPDDQGRFDRSIVDIQGELLIVSQFTLYGNCKKGRRPSFDEAAPPAEAKRIYDEFITLLKAAYPHVQTGEFGASMSVSLVNDGPVTFVLESGT